MPLPQEQQAPEMGMKSQALISIVQVLPCQEPQQVQPPTITRNTMLAKYRSQQQVYKLSRHNASHNISPVKEIPRIIILEVQMLCYLLKYKALMHIDTFSNAPISRNMALTSLYSKMWQLPQGSGTFSWPPSPNQNQCPNDHCHLALRFKQFLAHIIVTLWQKMQAKGFDLTTWVAE